MTKLGSFSAAKVARLRVLCMLRVQRVRTYSSASRVESSSGSYPRHDAPHETLTEPVYSLTRTCQGPYLKKAEGARGAAWLWYAGFGCS